MSIAFVTLTSFLIVAEVVALLRLGQLRLESRLGIGRDGLRQGTKAPNWRLADVRGATVASPGGWQCLLFTSNSLIEFPELINGIRILDQELVSVIVLARGRADLTDVVVRALHLGVPVVPADALYERYRVRVMPFLTFVAPSGVIAAAGYANSIASVRAMWDRARDFETTSGITRLTPSLANP